MKVPCEPGCDHHDHPPLHDPAALVEWLQPKPLLAGDELHTKVMKARFAIREDLSWLMGILIRLRLMESQRIPTLAVEPSGRMLVNRKFAMACTPEELKVGIVHECMHLFLEHFARARPQFVQSVWTTAIEVTLNHLVFSRQGGMGLPMIQTITPIYEQYPQLHGLGAEDAYYKLLEEGACFQCQKPFPKHNHHSIIDPNKGTEQAEESNPFTGEDGTAPESETCDCPSHSCVLGGENMTDEERELWNSAILNAARDALSAGKLPGSLQNFFTELTTPKQNWKFILARDMQSLLRRRFTFKRLPRRTAAYPQVRTPGRESAHPRVVLGFDTSGSMSDADLNVAFSESYAIAKLVGGSVVGGLFDAALYHFGDLSLNNFRALPVQRGGTDFRPFFEAVEKVQPYPTVIVLFSDLCGPFPDQPPKCPIIYCRPSGYKVEPPWPGRILETEYQRPTSNS